MLNRGCECTKRTYITKWTWDECVAFLERKNIYDTFLYEFSGLGTPRVVFRQSLRHMAGNLHAEYDIELLPCREGARFRVRFPEEEWFSGSPLPDNWLDEFFAAKLDAVPAQ